MSLHVLKKLVLSICWLPKRKVISMVPSYNDHKYETVSLNMRNPSAHRTTRTALNWKPMSNYLNKHLLLNFIQHDKLQNSNATPIPCGIDYDQLLFLTDTTKKFLRPTLTLKAGNKFVKIRGFISQDLQDKVALKLRTSMDNHHTTKFYGYSFAFCCLKKRFEF